MKISDVVESRRRRTTVAQVLGAAGPLRPEADLEELFAWLARLGAAAQDLRPGARPRLRIRVGERLGKLEAFEGRRAHLQELAARLVEAAVAGELG